MEDCGAGLGQVAADRQEGPRSGWHTGSEGMGAHTARKVAGPSLDLILRVERSAEMPPLLFWAVWDGGGNPQEELVCRRLGRTMEAGRGTQVC